MQALSFNGSEFKGMVNDVDVCSGYGVPEQILDEKMIHNVKYYLITWCDKPASLNSWQKASEYDDGAYGGAYVELVKEWEEYKKTDPQYATTATTTTNTTYKKYNTKHKPRAKPNTTTTSNKPARKRKNSIDSIHSTEY